MQDMSNMGFFGNKPAYGAPTQMGGFGQRRQSTPGFNNFGAPQTVGGFRPPHIDPPGAFGGGQQRQNFGQPQPMSGWPGGPPPPIFTRNLGFRVEGGEDPYAPRGMKQNDDYNRYYRNYDAYNQFVGSHKGAAGMNLLGGRDPATTTWNQMQRIMNRRYDRLGEHQGGPTLPPGPQQAPAPGGIGPGMGGRGATVNGMGQGIEPFLQRILGMISPEGPMGVGGQTAPGQPRPRSIWDQ
jgi:hypothetical protein